MGPSDGFRPYRTKGDDGGRHRRRRQVNRVFISWHFDRPDFLDLESHSGGRASSTDGRYFSPTEVTPLIVVLHSRRCRTRLLANLLRSWAVLHRIVSIEPKTPHRHCHRIPMARCVLSANPDTPVSRVQVPCGGTMPPNHSRPSHTVPGHLRPFIAVGHDPLVVDPALKANGV